MWVFLSSPLSPHPVLHLLTNRLRQCDDLILRKINSSDASVFAKRYGGSSQCWGVIWSLISLGFMAAGIVAGIAAFPQSAAQQRDDSQHFIPTKS